MAGPGSTGEAAVRSARDRIEKRIGRLQSLTDSGATSASRAGRLLVWKPAGTNEPVSRIMVRSRFLLRDEHHRRTRIQEAAASRSAALQVFLLALFELQARHRIGAAHTRLPIRYRTSHSVPSWVDITALPTADSTSRRSHARRPSENRERQIKAALDRLEACGRVELRAKRVHGRYEEFIVLNEGTDNGPGRGYTYYTRPSAGRGRTRRKVVTVPAEFFLNGWIDALTDNEIITYLVLRLMAQAFPNQHVDSGVYLTQADRVNLFNLDRAFEAHRMLSRYGLIETIRDARRNADGTMTDFEEVGTGEIHHFKLHDEALGQPAIPRVTKSLTQFAEGLDSDLAALSEYLSK